jgi:hypothetical protein
MIAITTSNSMRVNADLRYDFDITRPSSDDKGNGTKLPASEDINGLSAKPPSARQAHDSLTDRCSDRALWAKNRIKKTSALCCACEFRQYES